MADKQVVRQDVIQITWDVEDSPLEKLTSEANEFQSTAGKAIGKTESKFDDLTKSVQKTSKNFDSATKSSNKFLTSIKKVDKEKFKQLTSGVDNLTKKIGTGLVSAAKKAVVSIAAIGTAGAAGVYKLTDMASDLSETVNKVEVSFGDSSDSVMEWSKTSIKNMGLAQQTALDMAALFGDMGTGMGIPQEEAAKMSMSLTQLGADLASFKNMGIEDVTTALNGVFTGETESLKRLGIVMTQTNLEQFAMSQGISKGIDEMTEAEKVNLRYAYVMSKTKNAQGDFVRTGGGFANQLRMIQEQLKQVGTTVGGVFIGSFEKVLGKLNDFGAGLNDKLSEVLSDGFQFDDIAKITPMLGKVGTVIQNIANKIKAFVSDSEKMKTIKSIFSAIKSAASSVATIIGSLAEKVWDFVTSTGFLNTVKSIVDGISKALSWVKNHLDTIIEVVIPLIAAIATVIGIIKAISTAMKIWSAIQWVLNSGLLACPITWIVLAIAALVAIIVVLVRHWDKVKEVALNCWNAIKNAFSAAASWFNTNVIQPVVGFFTGLWNKIKTGAQNLWSGICSVFSTIASWVYEHVISPVVNFFKGLATVLMVIVLGIVGIICQPLLKVASWVYAHVIQPIIAFFVRLWNRIKSIVNSVWNVIVSVWGVVSSWVYSHLISPVVNFFVWLWRRITNIVKAVWNVIKSVWSVIAGWVSSKIIEPIKGFFGGLWTKIKSVASGIKNSITDAFQEAWDKVTGVWDGLKKFFSGIWEGLKGTGSVLKDALVSIWKDAVKAIAKPVNKLIGGANWVLEKLGSEKKIAEWQPYARGTNGHPGGNAIVNDGRGAELVQMPDGQTFIPRGRNVLLPNAPKGMKVLNAERTAQLMGRKSPSFNYEEGTGFDLWDFFDNAKGLVGKVIEKFVDYDGIGGYALDAGKAMISTAKDAMSGWVKSLFSKFGGKSLENYDPSKGVEQWKSTVVQALKMEGQYSAANVKRTLYQMQTESGGNPRAINNWDSNAKKGTPSKGLMQVIDPTFKAYARKGYNSNIYDPLSNILASVRYAVSRYGTLANAYKGVGYANGVGTVRLPAYSPSSSVPVSNSSSTSNNYSPSFTLNMSGTVDRTTERTIKRWVQEALEETFDSMSRTSPRLTEV